MRPVLVYSDRYHIDLGLHVFPTRKYRLLHRALLDAGLAAAADLVEPDPAAWDDLALVHTPEYLAKVRTGTMTADDVAQLELPWSKEMAEGFRLMTGGTIRAARDAPSARLAVHLAGGLHHGFPDHGEGFCLFNDIAVAIRVMQRDGLASRAAVLDCDVHHGNGTAFIFGSDAAVFTCSIHQQHNYPIFKPSSSLDIGLADGADDSVYLAALDRALPAVLDSRPDVVFYLAGADPFGDDQLGGLALTLAGLRARDQAVVAAVRGADVPLVVTMAGGYARRVEDTVAAHLATVEVCLSE